jgi:hypothetical protein
VLLIVMVLLMILLLLVVPNPFVRSCNDRPQTRQNLAWLRFPAPQWSQNNGEVSDMRSFPYKTFVPNFYSTAVQ